MIWILYAAVLMALFYEAWALVKSGTTISAMVWALSKKPLFPFAIGFLMGHFFWQR